MDYRSYQQDLDTGIFNAWNSGAKNVCAVAPTGGGKTVVMAGVTKKWEQGNTICIAHRKELVGQIAMALAVNGVPHQVFGPPPMVKYCMNRQRQKLKTHLHSTSAKTIVASVDTLVSASRSSAIEQFRHQVGLWIIDEGHHVLKDNKWGTAVDLFPNAHGLGFTATPCRADGKGLGRHNHGVYDELVEGPTMRELIALGYLCDYKIYAPLTYMPLSDDDIGKAGDYSKAKLKAASKKSTIIGDVVQSYRDYCAGKPTVVFATDLETAGDMRASYCAAGYKAEVVSSENSDIQRSEILDRFERRELDIIINVDLLGEGFDCPGIECCIFARKTESYGLYCQQFGRALRILDGKIHAIIIDHVGNVVRHGLPDAARVWSLESKEAHPRSKNLDDDIPLRYCVECTQPYSRFMVLCPYCGHYPTPDDRSGPEFVDGDIYEISPEVLARMRGEVAKIDVPASEVARRLKLSGAAGNVVGNVFNQVEARSKMQHALRTSMQWWAAEQNMQGYNDREATRRFYHRFGIDVVSAQALGRPDARILADKINRDIGGFR